MKIPGLLPVILLAAIITSCSKSSDTVKPVTPTNPTNPTNPVTPTTSDVYMAGIVNNKATLWKNGVATTLSSTSQKSYAYSVYVNGPDVYVAGYGTDANNANGVAILWKNGSANILQAANPDAQAVSVYVSPSGSVYAAGYTTVMYQNNQPYPNNGIMSYHAATIWINGTPTILSDGNEAFYDNNGLLGLGQKLNRDSGATGVYANGTDVYVSGWEDYGAYEQINATLWKNKNKLILYNPIGGNYTSNAPAAGFVGKFFSGDTTYVIPPTFSLSSSNQATSVFASSSGVYVAGFVTQGVQNTGVQANTTHRATLWTNGIEKALGDSTQFATPNAVYASGSNVYAAGVSIATGKSTPVVWKNGAPSTLTYNGYGALVKSIFVLGSDVYVAGTEITNATDTAYKGVLWKNGSATEFSDATNTTFITSVFVK